jgi:hypothetical protein
MRATLFLVVASLVGAVAPAQTKQAVDASPKDKIQQAKQLLGEAKKALMNDGKYNCCIKDACDRCALDHQNCDCATDVKAGKAICPDCYAGWQRGDGNVPGVSARKVAISSHSHKHQ